MKKTSCIWAKPTCDTTHDSWPSSWRLKQIRPGLWYRFPGIRESPGEQQQTTGLLDLKLDGIHEPQWLRMIKTIQNRVGWVATCRQTKKLCVSHQQPTEITKKQSLHVEEPGKDDLHQNYQKEEEGRKCMNMRNVSYHDFHAKSLQRQGKICFHMFPTQGQNGSMDNIELVYVSTKDPYGSIGNKVKHPRLYTTKIKHLPQNAY